MTSDGISAEDWDVVVELSTKIADSVDNEHDYEICVADLMQWLDKLEQKYGVRPSTLSTRADYVSDIADSLSMLKEAFILSQSLGDKKNMTFIASSIAEKYIEDLSDFNNGELWLNELGRCLEQYYDDGEHDTFLRLEETLNAGGGAGKM